MIKGVGDEVEDNVGVQAKNGSLTSLLLMNEQLQIEDDIDELTG